MHLLRQHIIFTSVLSDLSYYSTNDIQKQQKWGILKLFFYIWAW